MSNYTCISTGHQLNIPSLDKSSTVYQLTSTGQLVLLEFIKNATGILLRIPYWMCEELQKCKRLIWHKICKVTQNKKIETKSGELIDIFEDSYSCKDCMDY